jgi:threonine/homoserine/homoserine lactone efflux protein
MSATYRAVPWGPLAALVVTSLAIMGSPGPATISLTAAGSAFGFRRSLAYLAGIAAGTWLVLVAVAAGVTAALLAVPGLRPLLVAGAAAYIVWLAYHIATAPPLAGSSADASPPRLSGGVLLGVANPKAWVAIAAVFASARLANDAAVDAVAKVAVLTVMVAFINTAWLGVGASVAPLLRDARRARLVNGGLALTLLGATALAVIR